MKMRWKVSATKLMQAYYGVTTTGWLAKLFTRTSYAVTARVTKQPDMGSIMIEYVGPKIRATTLLQYIVSYRQHSDFHEACVERIFLDIQKQCKPENLTVYARFNRRGGLDINPYRTTPRRHQKTCVCGANNYLSIFMQCWGSQPTAVRRWLLITCYR